MSCGVLFALPALPLREDFRRIYHSLERLGGKHSFLIHSVGQDGLRPGPRVTLKRDPRETSVPPSSRSSRDRVRHVLHWRGHPSGVHRT